MVYDPADADELRDDYNDVLRALITDPALDDVDVIGAIGAATATMAADNHEESLDDLADQSFLDTATDDALTRKAEEYGVERRGNTRATGVLEFTRDSKATTDYTVANGTRTQTANGDVTFETTEQITINGPQTKTDSNTYTEGSTSYDAKTTHDIDVRYRDSITVSAEIKTDNNSHDATVKIVDTTNNTDITEQSTSNTTFTKQDSSYDVSGISDTITVEYKLKVADSSAQASMQNAEVDADGQTGSKANARAVDRGTVGNLPADRLTSLPSPPTGVDDVTNPDPTGDDNYTDTDGDALVPGEDREKDDELRNRVFDSNSVGGAATTGSIEQKVLSVDSVQAVTIFANDTDSTDANGLPPYSNEVIVTGGDKKDIGDALVDAVSVTELFRLQSNIVGNSPSGGVPSVQVDVLDKTVDVDFSRPVEVTLEISADIDTLDDYVGEDEVADRIVDYVGGTFSSGSTHSGLDTGNNVYVDRIEDAIVDEETGVRGLKNLVVDKDGDGNDDTTTDSNGITVISIAQEEQATLDADNVSLSEI